MFSSFSSSFSGKGGATYISPFLGRLDDVSQDGVGLIEEIVQIYDNYDLDTQVLAASIRHPKHVVDVAMAGADVGTMPFGVLRKLFNHPLTDAGNAKFLSD